MKNTGRNYESLIEQVFVQLIEQDSVKNICVERNKVLQGKTTNHEIDVYWEFLIGGIKYSTIIQAKDWLSKVPQGEMLKLKAILEDLPGQPRGMFITKTGYQSGAMDVAKANGIILYEFREPTEKDWKGKIKTIVLDFKAYMPDTKIEIIPDDIWTQNEFKGLKIKPINISISGMENEIFIKNEDGSTWKSIYDLKEEEQKKIGMVEVRDKEVIINLCSPKYIETGDFQFPRIKIKEIKAILSKDVYNYSYEIDGTTMVGYILKNIIDGSEVIFDRNVKLKK